MCSIARYYSLVGIMTTPRCRYTFPFVLREQTNKLTKKQSSESLSNLSQITQQVVDAKLESLTRQVLLNHVKI